MKNLAINSIIILSILPMLMPVVMALYASVLSFLEIGNVNTLYVALSLTVISLLSIGLASSVSSISGIQIPAGLQAVMFLAIISMVAGTTLQLAIEAKY